MKPTIGERLIALKDHSRLSLAAIAERGGYSGASSIQKFFNPGYDPPTLSRKAAEKLTRALEGLGHPPILALEIQSLAGPVSDLEDVLAKMSHWEHVSAKDIQILESVRIKDARVDMYGKPVPTFKLNLRKDELRIPCPDSLRGRQAVGFFVGLNNLWPRYELGELAVFEHQRPPATGDDVVVRFSTEKLSDQAAYAFGRLKRMTDEAVVVEQLNPAGDLMIDREDVANVFRLLTRMDLLPDVRSVIEA